VDRSDSRSPETPGDQKEKSKERGDRGGQVGVGYPGRLFRDGSIESEQRIANRYNDNINKSYFQDRHQRAINSEISIPDSSSFVKKNIEREPQVHTSHIQVRHGVDAGLGAPPEARQVRMPYEGPARQEPHRDAAERRAALDAYDSMPRAQMKMAGRDLTQRKLGLEEPSRPGPQASQKRDFALER
jgi:hypothetical protein